MPKFQLIFLPTSRSSLPAWDLNLNYRPVGLENEPLRRKRLNVLIPLANSVKPSDILLCVLYHSLQKLVLRYSVFQCRILQFQ